MAKFVAVLEFTEAEELRLATRPTHREYLRTLFDEGKLVMSGPWGDDTGAMLIYEAADMAEAEGLLDADPYRAAGVIAEARIKEWRVVLGAFAGSRTRASATDALSRPVADGRSKRRPDDGGVGGG